MIDWITAKVPLDWKFPIAGGFNLRLDRHGVREVETALRRVVRGSWDASFTIRTVEAGILEISGNPSKFLQGHNVFGSNDLVGLVVAALRQAIRLYNMLPDVEPYEQIHPTIENVLAWHRGEFWLTRVDINESFAITPTDKGGRKLRQGTPADVETYIAAMDTATVKWRGRGVACEGTRYFGRAAKGKRASPWEMKLYCKATELLAHGRRLPEDIPDRERVEHWVGDKLRVEVTLRGQELRRLFPDPNGGFFDTAVIDEAPLDIEKDAVETTPSLRYGYAWNEKVVLEVFRRYVDKIQLGDREVIDMADESKLSVSQAAIYNLWKMGADIRAIYKKRSTLYLHRKNILDALGIDILAGCPAEDRANVVSLRKALSVAVAEPPAWAKAPIMFRRAA